VLFAQASVGLLRRLAPVRLPRVDEIAVDGVILLFTLLLSIATALLFGLLPVLKFGTLDFHVLKDVDGLQQPGSEYPINLNRSRQDRPGELIERVVVEQHAARLSKLCTAQIP
jgi:hypothetical protein